VRAAGPCAHGGRCLGASAAGPLTCFNPILTNSPSERAPTARPPGHGAPKAALSSSFSPDDCVAPLNKNLPLQNFPWVFALIDEAAEWPP